MQRIINLSNSDLSGVAAAIAIRTAHPNDHVKTEFVGEDSVYIALKKACDASIPWDRIILSDISIKVPGEKANYNNEEERILIEELAESVKSYVDNGGEFVVLDYKYLTVLMKEYFQSIIHEESILQLSDEEPGSRSGSEIAARYMNKKMEFFEDPLYSDEVITQSSEDDEDDDESLIIQYSIYEYAKKVEELCSLAGDLELWRDPFGIGGMLALGLELMDDPYGAMENLSGSLHIATALDLPLIESMEDNEVLCYYYNMASDKLAGAINLTEKSLVEHHPKIHEIQTRFFSSHCAMHVYQKTGGVVVATHPNNGSKVYFSCHSDCGVDLGNFCSRFGGEGQAKAAGLTIPDGLTLGVVIEELKKEIDLQLD